MIDTHCHLVSEELRPKIQELLQRAQQVGVKKIINIAYDPQTVQIAYEQLSLSPMLFCALGIQPHDAHKFTEEEAEKIRSLALAEKRVVAIGEIGLDDYHKIVPLSQQIECFEYFLQMALDLSLPVVVHVRETHNAVLSLLKTYCAKGLTGVIHCFTGTLSEARDFLDCGFYISFSGIVTFKNARELQETALFIPENKLLIETDSPYLAPAPLRGKVNEPSFIIHTCNFLAQIKNKSQQNIAEITSQNAGFLFKKIN